MITNPIYTIILAILFVVVSYCGFWIAPAAAPARVALALICLLTAHNHYTHTIKESPPVTYSVWMWDFLFGCLIFETLTIIEYGFVNYGMKVDALLVQLKKAGCRTPRLPHTAGTAHPAFLIWQAPHTPPSSYGRVLRDCDGDGHISWGEMRHAVILEQKNAAVAAGDVAEHKHYLNGLTHRTNTTSTTTDDAAPIKVAEVEAQVTVPVADPKSYRNMFYHVLAPRHVRTWAMLDRCGSQLIRIVAHH